jgi:hypothetical protein
MSIVDRAIHSGRVLYTLLALNWLLLAAGLAFGNWKALLFAGVALLTLAPLLGRHTLAKREAKEREHG